MSPVLNVMEKIKMGKYKKIPIKEFPKTHEQFSIIYEDVLRYITHDRHFVAGGCATYMIGQDIADSKFIPSDIDIYSYDKSSLSITSRNLYDTFFHALTTDKWNLSIKDGFIFTQKIKEQPRLFFSNTLNSMTMKYTPIHLNGESVLVSHKNLSVSSSIMGVPLQVIKFCVGAPSDVISSFDLSCVCVAVDKDFVYTKESVLNDISNKVIKYNVKPSGYSYNTKALFVRRIAKYCGKGFKVDDTDIIENILSEKSINKPNSFDDGCVLYTLESLCSLEKSSFYNIFTNLADRLALPMFLSPEIESKHSDIIKTALKGWMNVQQKTY